MSTAEALTFAVFVFCVVFVVLWLVNLLDEPQFSHGWMESVSVLEAAKKYRRMSR